MTNNTQREEVSKLERSPRALSNPQRTTRVSLREDVPSSMKTKENDAHLKAKVLSAVTSFEHKTGLVFQLLLTLKSIETKG